MIALRPMIAWVLPAAAVVLLLVAGPAACRAWQAAKAEAQMAGEQGAAARASGADAVAAAGAAAARERASSDLDRTNEQEIRHAQGADDAVADASTAAGIDGLCRRAAYRDSERCRLRGAAAR